MGFIGLEELKELNPGNEVVNNPIAYDWIVKDLIDIQKEVIEIMEATGIRDPENKVFTRIYKDVEVKLTKRFGCNVKLVYDMADYACEIVGPITETGVFDIKNVFTGAGRSPITTAANVAGAIEKTKEWQKISKFNRWLEENPMVIDLDKAYISNWPKDVKVCIHWNIVGNTSKYYLKEGLRFANKLGEAATVEELVAPVLHEIGHCFTGLSSLYQSRRNRIILEDTIRDQIKKGTDTEEAIVMGFKSAFKDDKLVSNYNGKSVKEVILRTLRSEQYKFQYGGGLSSKSDAESQADQFATRLGVGLPLASFLTKFELKRNYYQIDFFIYGNIFFWFTAMLIMITIKGSPFFWFLNLLYINIVALAILMLIGGLLYILSDGEANALGQETVQYSYDPGLRRIQRIRLDLVRQLRTKNIPKELRDKYVNELDLIQDLCSKFNNYIGFAGLKISSFSDLPLLGYFSRYYGTGDIDKYEKMIEESMENDLHVAVNRF